MPAAIKLQKILYDLIEATNGAMEVYSCPHRNVNFPYVVIEISRIHGENNFNHKIHNIHTSIKIFDRNESNTPIITLANDIREAVLKLYNLQQENFEIVDVSLKEDTLKMYNELNSVWSEILDFEFITRELAETQ